jgi:uncharacterized membrane protein
MTAFPRLGPPWALVSAAVGVLLILLSRVGIAGVVAQLATTIGRAAATMFAVPIVISQGPVVSAGLAAYLNPILFRFAVGQPIPGVDPPHLSMPSAAS